LPAAEYRWPIAIAAAGCALVVVAVQVWARVGWIQKYGPNVAATFLGVLIAIVLVQAALDKQARD
jgi:hypothetical protein